DGTNSRSLAADQRCRCTDPARASDRYGNGSLAFRRRGERTSSIAAADIGPPGLYGPTILIRSVSAAMLHRCVWQVGWYRVDMCQRLLGRELLDLNVKAWIRKTPGLK